MVNNHRRFVRRLCNVYQLFTHNRAIGAPVTAATYIRILPWEQTASRHSIAKEKLLPTLSFSLANPKQWLRHFFSLRRPSIITDYYRQQQRGEIISFSARALFSPVRSLARAWRAKCICHLLSDTGATHFSRFARGSSAWKRRRRLSPVHLPAFFRLCLFFARRGSMREREGETTNKVV